MSGHKKRRSSKKRSAGRVRDRLNIETDPAILFLMILSLTFCLRSLRPEYLRKRL